MTRKKIADFIKNSVERLIAMDDATTFRLELDDDFALYVGWEEGFDEKDTDFIHSLKKPNYCICIKIAENGMDFSWEGAYMPWYVDGGEVYDTDVAISNNEDYNELADSMLYYYDDIRELFDNEEITL